VKARPFGKAQGRPRLLSLMAHQDDWEYTTAGLWARLRARGLDFEGLVVTTTDGRSGHQTMLPPATARRRQEEARRAAAALGCRSAVLRDARGRAAWNGQLTMDTLTRGAVWKLIRDFRPDVLFCPPRAAAWTAGCHHDHVTTGTLVWSVAYQVQVPHAFPQYGLGRERSSLTPPLIVAAYDDYLQGRDWDLAVDVGAVFDRKVETLHRHRSQVYEWLPWVGKYPAPRDRAALAARLRERHRVIARRAGLPPGRPWELFFLTRWGRPCTREDLRRFFPGARVAPRARRSLLG